MRLDAYHLSDIRGTAFNISPDTPNLGQVSEGSSNCVAGLIAESGMGKSRYRFAARCLVIVGLLHRLLDSRRCVLTSGSLILIAPAIAD